MIVTLTKADFKEIPLINSDLFAIVDAQDYDYVMQWQWKIARGTRKQPCVFRSSKNRHYYLHREIACLYQDYVTTVRHFNGNTLDNRRSNLKATLKSPRIVERREIIGKISDLNPSERETAELVALGLKDKEIAEIRCIALKTICSHIWTINSKLGTNNRTEIARLVLDNEFPATSDLLPLPEYKPIAPIPDSAKPINQLKKQRLLSAQMIVDARDAIAHQISQLQQIHADLENCLKIMAKP